MRPERKWTEDDQRFKELVLYVCERSANDPKFGATKLNKTLYFADFLAFAELGAPITGFEYQKLPKGPAPRRMVSVRDEMVREHALAIQPVKLVSGRVQERPVNLRSAQLSMFTPEQIALVDAIIEALRDATAEEVSELSHRMVGWKIVDQNDTIPYETIFVSDEPLTEADIERAKELAKQLVECGMSDDDWFTSSARHVRFEHLFDEQLKELGVDPEWLDDAMVGLDLALARHPEIFPKVPGTNLSCAKLVVYKNAPSLRAFFTYDATTVKVICVEFAE